MERHVMVALAQRLGMTIEGQTAHPALANDVDVWSARRS
jgi:hypothetical protein